MDGICHGLFLVGVVRMAQWMLQLVTLIVTTLAGSAVVRDADALAVDQAGLPGAPEEAADLGAEHVGLPGAPEEAADLGAEHVGLPGAPEEAADLGAEHVGLPGALEQAAGHGAEHAGLPGAANLGAEPGDSPGLLPSSDFSGARELPGAEAADHGRTQPGFLQVEAEVQTDAETLWRQLPPEMQGRLREEASRDVLIQILQTMTSLVNQQNERMGAVEAEQLAARKRGDALEARCSTRITNALLALRPGTIAVSGEPSAPSTGAANASAAPAGPQKLFGKVISPVVSSPEDPKPQRCGTCAQCRSTPMRKCAGLTKWYARQRKRAQEDEDGREKKIAKVPMDEHRPLGNGNPDDEPGDGGGAPTAVM